MPVRAIISIVLFLSVCGVAGWSGGRVVQRFDLDRDVRNDRQTRSDLARFDLGAGGAKSLLENADRIASYSNLPPAPLAGMAVGVSPLMENALRPEIELYRAAFAREPLESGHFLRDWHLDTATVILLALPVLILFGPGLDPLLAIAAGLVGSLAGFLAAGPDFGNPGVWIRLALWLAVTGAYGWFWSMARRWLDKVKGGEAAGIVLYAVVVFLLPGLVMLAVRTVFPVPSGAAVLAEIRQAGQAQEQGDAAALAPFHGGHPSIMNQPDPAEYDRRKLQSVQAWEKIAAGPVASYRAAVARHRFVAHVLRAVSPAAAAQGALVEIAGTGNGRYSDFEAQMENFTRTQWLPFFAKRVAQGQSLTVADLDQLPKFTYAENGAIGELLPSLLLMLPILAAGFWLSRK
jgi:ABC-2 type transport system permease protein